MPSRWRKRLRQQLPAAVIHEKSELAGKLDTVGSRIGRLVERRERRNRIRAHHPYLIGDIAAEQRDAEYLVGGAITNAGVEQIGRFASAERIVLHVGFIVAGERP